MWLPLRKSSVTGMAASALVHPAGLTAEVAESFPYDAFIVELVGLKAVRLEVVEVVGLEVRAVVLEPDALLWGEHDVVKLCRRGTRPAA